MMRWSKTYIPTLKEVPRDAEVVSHRLMLRAGMMRRLALGVYTYLPLGWRVIRKVEQIVREEMDAVDGLEMLMPILHPAELWKESGRWDDYGPDMMRLSDRHSRDFALGPTHEEVITDLVLDEVRSYRQLPLILYQIQTKFRDEIRPRFGVMRGREFIMKDAYSFHRDTESLDKVYDDMYRAYSNIFSRCGLAFRPVLADSGVIGGDATHEFMVLAESGETLVLSCPNEQCGYAATDESAESAVPEGTSGDDLKPLGEVHTPGMRTVEEVCAFLKVEPRNLVKTLIYQTPEEVVALLIPGDRDINEAKVHRLFGTVQVEMASPETIQKVTGADVGFAGPIGPKVRTIADPAIRSMTDFVTGANKTDYHAVNVNVDRDFHVDQYADLVLVRPGDRCIRCDSTLTGYRGIEVGQIFKLGTKYSEAMGAGFTDEDGEVKPFIMGCYGIGVTRTVASIIEQHHDDRGIIWPMSVAPYQVLITPISADDARPMTVAEEIYQGLSVRRLEVLLDDRSERPGVKFNDGDLIGIPIRITVGSRGLSKNIVEIKIRRTGETTEVPVGDAVDAACQLASEGDL